MTSVRLSANLPVASRECSATRPACQGPGLVGRGVAMRLGAADLPELTATRRRRTVHRRLKPPDLLGTRSQLPVRSAAAARPPRRHLQAHHARPPPLFLTYWTAGDTRNRGREMLAFARTYRSTDVAPPRGRGRLPAGGAQFALDPEGGATVIFRVPIAALQCPDRGRICHTHRSGRSMPDG